MADINKIKINNVTYGVKDQVARDKMITESITYDDLVFYKATNKLIPGKYYRITDYVTTTTLEDTQSAGHPFDVIVRADDVNKLNETAYAAVHSGDTYFANSKLEAWKLKYCLENDTNRFAWADTANGKGVIYYMKDEYFNECPYDFKNIQYKLYKTTDTVGIFNGYCAIDTVDQAFPSTVTIDESDFIYGYTFWSFDEDSIIQDSSKVIGIVEVDGGVWGNTIKEYYGVDNAGIKLNRIAFCTDISCHNNYIGYGCECMTFGNYCYSNTFGNDCYSNTFGNNCSSNTFGNDCYSNTFGNGCSSNTFGNGCSSNTFGNNCHYNTFGNDCYFNTFGNNCSSNTFGNSCHSNTFGNSYYSNTFGNDYYSNTFGNDCYSNIFGNNCHSNTFGNSCSANTFGNNCHSNTFGNNCPCNTFGNNCYSNTFGNSTTPKSYVRYVIFENGNQYIDLQCSATTSSASPLRNITIAQGVNNTSTRKTITHLTAGDTFKTTYQPANSQIINV